MPDDNREVEIKRAVFDDILHTFYELYPKAKESAHESRSPCVTHIPFNFCIICGWPETHTEPAAELPGIMGTNYTPKVSEIAEVARDTKPLLSTDMILEEPDKDIEVSTDANNKRKLGSYQLNQIQKAIAAFPIGVLSAIGTALLDGELTKKELSASVGAGILASMLIFKIKNKELTNEETTIEQVD